MCGWPNYSPLPVVQAMLIPGSCEYGILLGEEDFANGISGGF